MIRVVVVEDHVLVRQSLVKTIKSEPGFEVVGEAGDVNEAVALAERTHPDFILLDVEIPGGNGFDVAERIKATQPDVRILFLTMHDDDTSIRQAVACGADGFVPKTAAIDELLTAIKTVMGGGTYLSPAIARRVMDLAGGRSASRVGELTERELEILNLLAHGSDHDEVAAKLYVSTKTVKNHLTSIYLKLGVKSAAQAVAAAYREGLVARGPRSATN